MAGFDPSSIDVEHFLDALGVENVGRATQHEMRFSCPFPNHAGGDEKPSAYMNVASTAFFCHGCKEKGTAIDLAAYVLRVSPLEASRLLRQAYQPGGIDPDARDMEVEVRRIMAPPIPPVVQPRLKEELLDGYAMDWCDAWCEYSQTHDESGWFSMFARGFEPETMADWQFGWCERTQRIVFPVRDETGTLIGFKGRVGDDRRPKYLIIGDGPDQNYWGFPRYFPSHVVFGADRYKDGVDVPLVVCEGELNAIATTQKTSRPAIAINGSYFTAFHARIIRKIARQGVILFFDEDEAGQRCTWGWQNSRGEWHPGVVDLLAPYMSVLIAGGHEADAADMSPDEVDECLDSARDQLLIRVEELVSC